MKRVLINGGFLKTKVGELIRASDSTTYMPSTCTFHINCSEFGTARRKVYFLTLKPSYMLIFDAKLGIYKGHTGHDNKIKGIYQQLSDHPVLDNIASENLVHYNLRTIF